MPIARPRCVWNQRFATVAANVMAATPVPPPTITPQINTICQGAVISDERAVPEASSSNATMTVGRMPKRCIAAAANGPVNPYSARFTEMASEMVARLQPKSCSSGTIITLGASLGLDVVAEGVETEEQRVFLERNGCELWQGYLLSRPVPLEDYEALVLERAERNSQLDHDS